MGRGQGATAGQQHQLLGLRRPAFGSFRSPTLTVLQHHQLLALLKAHCWASATQLMQRLSPTSDRQAVTDTWSHGLTEAIMMPGQLRAEPETLLVVPKLLEQLLQSGQLTKSSLAQATLAADPVTLNAAGKLQQDYWLREVAGRVRIAGVEAGNLSSEVKWEQFVGGAITAPRSNRDSQDFFTASREILLAGYTSSAGPAMIDSLLTLASYSSPFDDPTAPNLQSHAEHLLTSCGLQPPDKQVYFPAVYDWSYNQLDQLAQQPTDATSNQDWLKYGSGLTQQLWRSVLTTASWIFTQFYAPDPASGWQHILGRTIDPVPALDPLLVHKILETWPLDASSVDQAAQAMRGQAMAIIEDLA